jgi:hypothetical protein
MADEWGPWVDHDHKGVPVPFGTIVHRKLDTYADWVHGSPCEPTKDVIGPVEPSETLVWCGGGTQRDEEGRTYITPRVVRYRVRRFRGLTALEEIARGVRPVVPMQYEDEIETAI